MKTRRAVFGGVETVCFGDENASKVVILLHGRGGSGDDILALARHFFVEDVLYVAPTANSNAWYPRSFLEPVSNNEPFLSESLGVVQNLVSFFDGKQVFFVGFSQGACLSTEFVCRNPKRYGGVFCLSGGLIGDKLMNYSGDLNGTPVLLGCDEEDPFIPVSRVHETEVIMNGLNASVTKNIYSCLGHRVNEEEINFILNIIRK